MSEEEKQGPVCVSFQPGLHVFSLLNSIDLITYTHFAKNAINCEHNCGVTGCRWNTSSDVVPTHCIPFRFSSHQNTQYTLRLTPTGTRKIWHAKDFHVFSRSKTANHTTHMWATDRLWPLRGYRDRQMEKWKAQEMSKVRCLAFFISRWSTELWLEPFQNFCAVLTLNRMQCTKYREKTVRYWKALSLFLTKFYSGDQINEKERCVTCSNYGFWWGNLREGLHLEDKGVDGRTILKWIFRQWDGEIYGINLAQGRDRWRALVEAEMNPLVP